MTRLTNTAYICPKCEREETVKSTDRAERVYKFCDYCRESIEENGGTIIRSDGFASTGDYKVEWSKL